MASPRFLFTQTFWFDAQITENYEHFETSTYRNRCLFGVCLAEVCNVSKMHARSCQEYMSRSTIENVVIPKIPKKICKKIHDFSVEYLECCWVPFFPPHHLRPGRAALFNVNVETEREGIAVHFVPGISHHTLSAFDFLYFMRFYEVKFRMCANIRNDVVIIGGWWQGSSSNSRSTYTYTYTRTEIENKNNALYVQYQKIHPKLVHIRLANRISNSEICKTEKWANTHTDGYFLRDYVTWFAVLRSTAHSSTWEYHRQRERERAVFVDFSRMHRI